MKIVIVGGGTAGWLTALFLNRSFPDSQVALIESTDIGIIGAGEGTTPQLIPALEYLQIPLTDLISFADATIKHSIQFTNWRGDTKSYFHAFQPRSDLQFMPDPYSPLGFIDPHTDESFIYQRKFSDPYEAHNLAALLAALKKSPFFERTALLQSVGNPIELFDRVMNYAVHFNAVQLAELFKLIATQRGVVHIEGTVEKINSSPDDNIESLILEDGRLIDLDFVFDCSGFQRLIIGNHFKSKWVSLQNFLPTNKALAYFKPMSRPTPSYTTAIAMKNGWSWQIPLQTRYGAGYVYSDSFANEDEIKQEIETFEGDNSKNIEWGKAFSFEPGYYEDVWIKNCAAVGLSTGFLEPLEATSIMQTLEHLQHIVSVPMNLLEVPKSEKQRISKHNAMLTQEIAEFLYLHYLSDRSDTEFWKQFHLGAPEIPDFVSEMMQICSYRLPDRRDFLGRQGFSSYNWMAVIDGNGLIPPNQYDALYQSKTRNRAEEYLSLRRNIGIEARRCVDHDTFLSQMRY